MNAALKTKEIPGSTLLVSFDPLSKKEVEQAKSIYRLAKIRGRHVTHEGKDIEAFRQVLQGEFTVEAEGSRDPNTFAMHIFDETGDRRPMWRADRPNEVKEAAALFKEYVAKGWKAYAVSRHDPGQRGVRIYEFDPELEEVIFDDRTIAEKLASLPGKMLGTKVEEEKRTVRERLSKFVERFSSIDMLPKTYPG